MDVDAARRECRVQSPHTQSFLCLATVADRTFQVLQRSHELHVRLNSRNLVFCWTNESPMMKLLRCLTLAMCMPLLADQGQAQIAPLIQNINARQTTDLDGRWQTIIDPYDVGALDYRAQQIKGNGAFFMNHKPQSESELVEYDFDTSGQLNVPATGIRSATHCCFMKGVSGTSGRSITRSHRRRDCSCISGPPITRPGSI